MPDTNAVLQEKREAFNSFAATVIPAHTLERDDLGFSELARCIEDASARQKFCRLAIAMLDANIAHYRSSATRSRTNGANHTVVVASTLVIAGLVAHFAGTAAALVAAGIWYWLAATTAIRRAKDLEAVARAHNEEVAGWAETIKGWEVERDALRAI